MNYPWEMTKHEFFVAVCCFLCFFFITFNSTMVASILTPLQVEWGVDYSYAIWFKEDIAIAMIVFSLISVAISDKYGKKHSMNAGLVIVILGGLMCTFTSNFSMFMFFRYIMGLGVSLISVSSLSILTDVSKEKYLLETIALTTSASCLGAIFAPTIGMMWTEIFGVRTIFLMLMPVCLICMYAFRGIENNISRPDLKINIPLHVSFIVGVTLILMVLFNTMGDNRALLASIGIICIILFIIINHYSEAKIFDLRVFRISSFAIGLSVGVLFNFITHTMDDTISGYLQLADGTIIILGISVTLVALASFLSGLKPFIQMVFSPVVARYNKRHPRIDFTTVGFVILLVPIIFLYDILVTSNPNDLTIITIVTVIGLAVATTLFTPSNKKMMMASVGEEDRNFTSSMVMVVSPISKVLGMVIFTNLLDGNTTRASYSSSGMIMVGIFLVVFIIGTVLIMSRHIRKKRAESI